MGPALVSVEETSRLVKNLKAVLPVSIDSAVGGDTQRSSGDSPLRFCWPLAPSCAAASSVCPHGLSFPVSFR